MKSILFLMSLVLFVPFKTWAEPTTSIQGIPTDEETTISIKKGKKAEEVGKIEWEIVPGSVEIKGEGDLLKKEAVRNWKKACTDWKKETKETAKENGNQVVILNCGSEDCSTNQGETTCKSTAEYKLKVKK